MKNEKTKLLVIFEDDRSVLEAAAKQIKKHLGTQANVKLRSASETAVAEILAADAYAFGVDDPEAHAWAEIRRLLQGMNLAGRKAGFFSSKKGASAALKACFAPAELVVVDPEFDAAKVDGAGPWSETLLSAR